MKAHARKSKGAARGRIARLGGAALAIGLSVAGLGTTQASASPLGDAIVNFARARMGQCVTRSLQTLPGACPTLPAGAVGDGECTDLVQAALRAESAVPPSFHGPMPLSMLSRRYWWGTPVRMPYQAGDVIQFWYYSATAPNGSTWMTSEGHTAIIAKAYFGGWVTLLEQNNNGVRAVTSRTINLLWRHTGFFFVYRPQYAGPIGTIPVDAPVPRFSPATHVF